MADIQINGTNKHQFVRDHSGITHLCNETGVWTKDQIIFFLNERVNTYFILTERVRSEVSIYLQGYGVHLRAHSNGMWNDDLLALPKCPPQAG